MRYNVPMKKEKALTMIGKYVFIACLGLLIWVGLSAFLLSFSSMGQKEGVDFVWQMVGFSFLLATLVYSVNHKSLQANQRKRLPYIGIAFILSGVFLIVGFGIAMVATNSEPSAALPILKWMAQGFSLVATFCLAGGMTMMTWGFMGED